jgi:hypothetical protein
LPKFALGANVPTCKKTKRAKNAAGKAVKKTGTTATKAVKKSGTAVKAKTKKPVKK